MHASWRIHVLAGLLGTMAVAGARGAPPPEEELPIPTYTARRAVDPIVVDGKATEATWQSAERLGRFVTWDGKECDDLTDVKVAWNDEALYILFHCRDTDIQASLTAHDGELYREDVVEVFIDADGDGKTYMELIVNPLNATLDNYLLCDPRENPNAGILSWSLKNWATAVSLEGTARAPADTAAIDVDTSWTVEMAIPFASFVLTPGPSGQPPREGEAWRMAFTRYDRPDPKTFLHTAWSPPYSCGWPHITRRFGRVVFSAQPAGK